MNFNKIAILSLLIAATTSSAETVRYTIVDGAKMTAVADNDGWFEYPLGALPVGSTIDFTDGDTHRGTTPHTVADTWHTAYTVESSRIVPTTDIEGNTEPDIPDVPEQPENLIRITFICPEGWSNPHIHIYAPVASGDVTLVDNTPMSWSSGNSYYYMFDASSAPNGCNIMFNNNGWGNGGWNNGEVNTGFTANPVSATYSIVNGEVVKDHGTTGSISGVVSTSEIHLSGNRITGTAYGHVMVITPSGSIAAHIEANGEFETESLHPGLYIVATPGNTTKIIINQ